MIINIIHVVLAMGVLINVSCEVLKLKLSEECASKGMPLLSPSIPSESSPMVSAVLLECPRQLNHKIRQGSARKQPPCEEQLIVNIRVNPSFHIEKVEKFLILDEVYDPRRRTKAKILSPYLIEISRGEPVMMYPLEFTQSVKCDGCEAPIQVNETSTSNKEQDKNFNVKGNNQTCETTNTVMQKMSNVLSPVTHADSVNEKEECGGQSLQSTFLKDDSSTDTKEEGQTSERQLKELRHEDDDDSNRNMLMSNSQNEEERQKEDPPMRPKIINLASNIIISKEDSNQTNSPARDTREEQATVGIQKCVLRKMEDNSNLGHFGLIRSPNGAQNENGIKIEPGIQGKPAAEDDIRKSGPCLDITPSGSYNKIEKSNEQLLSKPSKESPHDSNLEYDENYDKNMIKQYDFDMESDAQNDGDVLDDDIGPDTYLSRKIDKRRRNFNNMQRKEKLQLREELPRHELTKIHQDYNVRKNTLERHDFANDGLNHGNYIGQEEIVLGRAKPLNDGNNVASILQELAEIKQKQNREVEGMHRLWIEKDYGDDDDVHRNNAHYKSGNYYLGRNMGDNINYKKINRVNLAHKNEDAFLRNKSYEPSQALTRRNKFRSQYNNDEIPEYVRTSTDADSIPLYGRNYGSSQTLTYNNHQLNGFERRMNNLGSTDRFGVNQIEPRTDGVEVIGGIYSKTLENPEMEIKYDNNFRSASGDELNGGKGAHDYLDNDKMDFSKYMYDTESLNNNDELDMMTDSKNTQFSDIYNSLNYVVLLPYEPDTAKNNKELSWLDSEPDSSDLLNTLNTVYTEKPLIQSSLLNNKYSSTLLQPTRSTARELIYKEPTQFLPKLPPYAREIHDPNLNIIDKLRLLEFVDPPNEQSERKLHQLTQELDQAVPVPFYSVSTNIHKLVDNNKKKRSFVFYDDLEMRETLDNDNNYDSMDQKRSQPSSFIHVEEDAQPCSSCGGKGKKPAGKSEPAVHTQENSCACRIKVRAPCSCASDAISGPVANLSVANAATNDSQKEERSVSETWYSVFNMSAPLPFLTTKLRIFRKRHSTWWKIAPSITLNSLSGTFANANLSILFSSHVDIFQLEKSIRLQNHQLIIPKDNRPMSQTSKISNLSTKKSRKANATSIQEEQSDLAALNTNPQTIFTIDGTKTTRQINDGVDKRFLSVDTVSNPSNFEEPLCSKIKDVVRRNSMSKPIISQDGSATIWNNGEQLASKRNTKNLGSNVIHTIGDLGYFPTSMNLLERCPNDKNHLCLNMLDDKVPVIVTATLDSDCGPPNHSETPPISSVAVKRTTTGNRIPVVKSKTVAMRQFMVEPESRCFCMWECSCHCVPKLETYVDFKVCQKLSYNDEKNAGLLLHCQPNDDGETMCSGEDEAGFVDSEENRGFYDFLQNALILLLIMLLLGLLKAVIGRFIPKVDLWGYGYVQPGRSYGNSSRCRRFFVNTFFFVVFPFVFWCKCFTPCEEDLLVASTEWPCSDGKTSKCGNDNKWDGLLLQQIDSSCTCCCTKSPDRLEGGQEISEMDKRITDFTLALNEHVFDDEEDEDEEVNTKFILQALVESRESLKKLLRDHSSLQTNVGGVDGKEDPKLMEAAVVVQSLKAAQIVYRVFDRPIGNVRNMPSGTKYCIQGYFLPSLGQEFEFVNYNPLAQYRCISPNGKSLEILRPPIMLCPKEFSRVYANKLDVLTAGDLSVHPPSDAPCINISTMAAVASSVIKLASEQNICGTLTSLPNPLGLEKRDSSVLSCNWQEFDLPVDEEEEQMEETGLEQSTTSDIADFNCSVDEEDLLEEESEEIISDSNSLDITTYKCDTIPE